MTIVCFFVGCRNGGSSHSHDYLQCNHHRSGILVLFPTGVLENIEVLDLYFAICLAGSDLVLCLLPLRRAQEVSWSHHGKHDPVSLDYKYTTGKVFYIPQQLVHEMLKTVSATMVDFSGH